jgi:hypothetical protein
VDNRASPQARFERQPWHQIERVFAAVSAAATHE